MESKPIESRMALRFGVAEKDVFAILKGTAFKTKDSNGQQATDAQMVALMIVADQYGLNPFTKELYAYPDKQNGIVPVVSVDGWTRIVNQHEAMNGIEFRYADEFVTMAAGKPCPEWCEVIITRKDREKPIVIREFLDEVYCPPRGTFSGPWQSHTKRMLRHKTLIQGARIAFGFSGIYDEDEAQRIVERDITGEASHTTETTARVIEATPPRTNEQFTAALEKWAPHIESGKKTHDEIIAFAESKAPLTDEQKKQILLIKTPTKGEAPESTEGEQA
ncbi:phage recombination protein Bet [Aquidulcibacter sp.]|uniref:phage recombination protein Bet n=1 Tax=Aquidulcibacter sp. TaxID=2052990 RepID=UPI00345C73F3|nr:phage recombination protein Bet [Aquidulcibacter sp.]